MPDNLSKLPERKGRSWAANRFARYLPLILLLVVAVTGGIAVRPYLTFEVLRTHHEALIAFRDQHYALTLCFFMLTYVGLVTFSLPGAALASLTGGFLFGLFPGALFNVVAATLGACAIFLAVRWGAGSWFTNKIDTSSGIIRRLSDDIRANEVPVLLLLRLVPAVPFFVANLIPALVGVSLLRFAVTTFLGIIPGGLVYTWVGAGLSEVFAQGQTPDLGVLFAPWVIGPIIGLCLLAALPVILKILGKKR